MEPVIPLKNLMGYTITIIYIIEYGMTKQNFGQPRMNP